MAFVQSKYRNPQQADYVKELQARVEALSAALRDADIAFRRGDYGRLRDTLEAARKLLEKK